VRLYVEVKRPLALKDERKRERGRLKSTGEGGLNRTGDVVNISAVS
jgi:hypothetical protein